LIAALHGYDMGKSDDPNFRAIARLFDTSHLIDLEQLRMDSSLKETELQVIHTLSGLFCMSSFHGNPLHQTLEKTTTLDYRYIWGRIHDFLSAVHIFSRPRGLFRHVRTLCFGPGCSRNTTVDTSILHIRTENLVRSVLRATFLRWEWRVVERGIRAIIRPAVPGCLNSQALLFLAVLFAFVEPLFSERATIAVVRSRVCAAAGPFQRFGRGCAVWLAGMDGVIAPGGFPTAPCWFEF